MVIMVLWEHVVICGWCFRICYDRSSPCLSESSSVIQSNSRIIFPKFCRNWFSTFRNEMFWSLTWSFHVMHVERRMYGVKLAQRNKNPCYSPSLLCRFLSSVSRCLPKLRFLRRTLICSNTACSLFCVSPFTKTHVFHHFFFYKISQEKTPLERTRRGWKKWENNTTLCLEIIKVVVLKLSEYEKPPPLNFKKISRTPHTQKNTFRPVNCENTYRQENIY